MITGISHITIIVRDLNRTSDLLKGIFDAKEVYSCSTAKYLLINELWIALNKGEALSERTYNHIAFQIPDDEVEEYIDKIKNYGLEIEPSRPCEAGEKCSIYFYDYDNHLIELHTGTLQERLMKYIETGELSLTDNQLDDVSGGFTFPFSGVACDRCGQPASRCIC